MNAKSIPTAEAELVKSEDGSVWLWVVRNCPHCHQEHVHGGGAMGNNPRNLLSHRVGHCLSSNVGYILVAVNDLQGNEGGALRTAGSEVAAC